MKLKFGTRIIILLFSAVTLCVFSAIFVAGLAMREQGADDLVSKSRAVLSRLSAAANFVAKQGGLQIAVESAKKNFPDGKLSDEEKSKVLKQVPIFAAMQIGSVESEKEHYKFRVFSDEPRNKDNTATAAEMDIFKKFLNDPKLEEIVDSNSEQVIVYRPVHLTEKMGCFTCHGNPTESPWKNGKDVLGFQMENWSDGKLHGVFAVISDLGPVKAEANHDVMVMGGWSGLVAVLAIILTFFLLRKPLGEVTTITQDLQQSALVLSSAANEISTSSQSLSSSASEAAASLEETTATTEEISSMIKLNAGNANQARALSKECEDLAKKGKEDVTLLVKSMSEISSSSKKIEDIINVIEDISFQTNLLALNAAVEAARAGEQGRGFSVVAEAVRGLAQRSATSAKEISDLIKDSVQMIHAGSELAERSGRAMTEIVAAVEKVSTLNNGVSEASNEQAQGVENINKAINELDKVTQQNAAASEETAAASEELNSQSQQLHGLVAKLNSVMTGLDEA